LMPPPPGCTNGSAQDSLISGFILLTLVCTSMQGLNVTVNMNGVAMIVDHLMNIFSHDY